MRPKHTKPKKENKLLPIFHRVHRHCRLVEWLCARSQKPTRKCFADAARFCSHNRYGSFCFRNRSRRTTSHYYAEHVKWDDDRSTAGAYDNSVWLKINYAHEENLNEIRWIIIKMRTADETRKCEDNEKINMWQTTLCHTHTHSWSISHRLIPQIYFHSGATV